MFAGHIGIALAATRVQPRVNVGALAAASLLLDVLLWLFVLLGVESVVIPPDFAHHHQPGFVFPYSHGLLAAVAWSAVAGVAFRALRPAAGGAAIIGAVVFSHWVLDALVHRPELPLLGAGSAAVGAGLWDHMALALGVESALVIAGLGLCLSGRRRPRWKAWALGAAVLFTLVSTLVGMTLAPPPPSAQAMAGSSLATIAVVCGLLGWLDAGAPQAVDPKRPEEASP